jgi:NAD(P)-dependent dehydrogenase (short-subunit alcohol dehydrogenase family)
MNHMFSRMHLDDLNWHTRRYSKWAAYGQSKLAVMLFTDELARRGVRAIVADPGGADTNIVRYSTGYLRWSSQLRMLRNFPQSAKTASRSSVMAVTADIPAGTYLCPAFKQVGKPRVTKPLRKARDAKTAQALWKKSAELTGCDWPC